MTLVAPTPVAETRRTLQLNLHALSAWTLSGALILYLGFSGGGYAFSTSGRIGILVWWCVMVACSWALLPATRLSRLAVATVAAFGAFTAWTALGITWSISSGRSFQDLGLITTYFGILVLAVSLHRERDEAIRHTVPAVATALGILAAFSVATRLWPGFIPSATHIAQVNDRLSWPLDYWNGLGAMAAMALPLMLSIATTARRLVAQVPAAAAIPVIALCGALTQSRGAVLETAAALVVWLLLSSQRLVKLVSLIGIGLASAAVIAEGFHERAIRTAETGALEHHQAAQMLLVLILACAAAAGFQAVTSKLARRVRTPRALSPSPRALAVRWGAGIAACVIIAVAAGVPHHLSHAWNDFKNPAYNGQAANHLSASSGEGRYQYWVAGIHSAAAHPFTGSGPGTFQLDWLPRAHIASYVINAHSLYVETYTELGIIGIGLLGAFIVLCLTAAIRVAIRSHGTRRTYAAAVTAALVAFFLGAAVDWLWQLPVLVAAVLLLAAGALAPQRSETTALSAPRNRWRLSARRLFALGLLVTGLAAAVAIIYPLVVTTDISDSQAAVNAGNLNQALHDARQAVSLEPGSGAANLQLALALERRHDFPAALRAARSAVGHEPDNWANWLTLSRISAENGEPTASLAAYRRARSLNPESPLFRP